jgi:hypothetical protein
MSKKQRTSPSSQQQQRTSNQQQLILLCVACVVVVLLAIVFSSYTPVTSSTSDKQQDTKLVNTDIKELESKKLFEKAWTKLSPVDKRNVRSAVKRIPHWSCKLQLIQSYKINQDGLYNNDHDLFNFESLCPAVLSDQEEEEDEYEEEKPLVKSSSVANDTKTNTTTTTTPPPPQAPSQEESIVKTKEYRPHIANDHNELKEQPIEPLNEKFISARTGYISNPNHYITQVPREYFNMKLAYLLILHNNLEHVKRLIKRIYHPNNYYVLHVDKKSSDSFKSELKKLVESLAKKKKNIVLYSAHSVTWGGASMVFATMDMMSVLFREFGNDWHYCINLSGADYPLRTNTQIVQELAVNEHLLGVRGINYLDLHLNDLRDNKSIKLGFTECNNYLYLTGWRPLPKGIDIWTGSQWFILAKDFCDYLMNDEFFVPKFLDYIRNQLVPDELFFQTVFKASPFCHHVVHHHLRFIKWGENAECFFDTIADSCGRHPDSFTMQDLPQLKIETTALFARKFSNSSDELLDELDKWATVDNTKKNYEGSYIFWVKEGQCLTAVDDRGVLVLPCNSKVEEQKGVSIPEQEWKIGPCSTVDDLVYDAKEKAFTQTKNSTMCSIMNVKYQTCLDYEGTDEPSSNIILYPCHFQQKQLWKFTDVSDMEPEEPIIGSVVANVAGPNHIPDLCLDMNEEMGPACLWPCNGLEQQRLYIERIN